MSMFGGRGRGGRGASATEKEKLPKAKFRQLLPYLAQHKGALILAAVLSVVGAAFSLAQPLLTGQVISAVQNGEPMGPVVGLLVALILITVYLNDWVLSRGK